MIEVLQDWEEIGNAYRQLRRSGLPVHQRVEKNWDLTKIGSVLKDEDRASSIVDLGCGGLDTLRFLTAMGFDHLSGIDLRLTLRERTAPLRTAIRSRTRPPFLLSRGSITATPYETDQFDVGLCISVIEHGVDTAEFFGEAGRIIKKGGYLILTTDYSESPIDTSSISAFGLPWRIFCRQDIDGLIGAAEANSFELLGEVPGIPPAEGSPVTEFGIDYTFIFLAFRHR